MGEAASVVKSLSCEAFAKYCCNAMHIKSDCCDGWCTFSYDTDMVEIDGSDSEYELESDCCILRKTQK